MLEVGEEELLMRTIYANADAISPSSGTGARIASRWLKKNVGEFGLVLPLEGRAAVEWVRAILILVGEEVVSPGPQNDGQWALLRVMVDGRYNPVVVTAIVESAGPGQSSVRLRAAAMEGSIKWGSRPRQGAGEKTAARIYGLLLSRPGG